MRDQQQPGLRDEELVGRPAPLLAEAWHRARLDACDPDGERARYHAAWLRHLASPADPEAALLVSVVIPAFEANAWIAEAVASVFAQSWPRVEVVVVDDGSTDPPQRVLGADPRLRILRQGNAGVSSARNHGIREARGELVHFLDADDVLEPDAIALKLEALRRIPDAELCFASYRVLGRHVSKRADTHQIPPIGDRMCPTKSLLWSAIRRYPFHTSSVLVARCLLLETGPMDESLVQGEDTRYWFQLGLEGAKVVAVDRELGTRRFVAGGLTSDDDAQRLATLLVALRNLCDLLERPACWPLVGMVLRKLRNRERWRWLHGSDPQMRALREQVLARVAEAGEQGRAAGLSAVPLVALFEGFAAERRRKAPPPEGVFLAPLEDALAKASAASLPIGLADLELWLSVGGSIQHAASAGLASLYAWIDSDLARPGAPFGLDAVPELCERWPRNGFRGRWRLAHRLAPWLGAPRALATARGIFVLIRAVRAPERAISRLRSRLRRRPIEDPDTD